MIPNAECIRGTIEKSSRQYFENSTQEEQVSEFFGRLLIENKWLPGPNGQFYKPSELGIDDLPEMFERNTKLANLLGMKKTEEVKAVNILSGGNTRKKELIEKISKATDDELNKFDKLIPKQSAPPPAPSFKDGLSSLIKQQHGQTITPQKKYEDGYEIHPVKNPERYQGKSDEVVANDLNEHMNTPQNICFSFIRIKPDNKEAREFIYNEYHGQCQITGATFPKARANAQGIPENYFEVCCLLSYSNADYLNNAGNMLCVSADTMAKLKYASFDWLENIEDKIAEFENMSGKAQCVGIKIKLAGEECTITWSQRHFMKFVSLYTQT